jgi:hypothetical protein
MFLMLFLIIVFENILKTHWELKGTQWEPYGTVIGTF